MYIIDGAVVASLIDFQCRSWWDVVAVWAGPDWTVFGVAVVQPDIGDGMQPLA